MIAITVHLRVPGRDSRAARGWGFAGAGDLAALIAPHPTKGSMPLMIDSAV